MRKIKKWEGHIGQPLHIHNPFGASVLAPSALDLRAPPPLALGKNATLVHTVSRVCGRVQSVRRPPIIDIFIILTSQSHNDYTGHLK